MTDKSRLFAKVPILAYEDRRLTPYMRDVLALLCSYSDKDGHCWPSQATIGERLGISRQAVGKHLKSLAKFGWVTWERQSDGGAQTSNLYQINHDYVPDDKWLRKTVQEEYTLPPLEEMVQPLTTPQPQELQEGATPEVAYTATPEVSQTDHLTDQTNRPKKEEPDLPPSPKESSMVLAKALAQLCQQSFNANKGRLLSEAKLLVKIEGFSYRLLLLTYGNGGPWYTADFRGLKGNPPTPKQIRETWLQYAPLAEAVNEQADNLWAYNQGDKVPDPVVRTVDDGR